MSTQTGQSCLLESVRGDEAARILLAHFGAGGLRPGARGVVFLRELAGKFAEFSYENVSKIIKASGAPSLAEAMRLPTEVVTDHFERNFGGTCFSLTFLFERVLRSLGFDCYKVMADMNSGRNVHCLVVVREGGAKYIVDPGYALYEVIALTGERVPCPHATVEVCPGGSGAYDLWTEDASGRKWRYRFQDSPVEDRAFQEHWLASFGKPTLHNICLTRMTPRGHIYLRRDFFKFTSTTSVEKRRIREGRERLVEEEFGIAAEWIDLAQSLLDRERKASGRVEVDARAGPTGETLSERKPIIG